jgi:transposase-like protein
VEITGGKLDMGTHGKSSRKLKFEIMQKHFQDKISIKTLAETYGISAQTVYGWRKQYREHGVSAFVGCGSSRSAEKEIYRLRTDNIRLKNERKRLMSKLNDDALAYDKEA